MAESTEARQLVGPEVEGAAGITAGSDIEVTLDVWSDEYRTDEFLRHAIEELRSEFGEPAQRYGVYFLDGLDPRSLLGRAVEVERFGDSFGNDVSMLRRLYGDFEDAGATELVCIVDHEELKPAGVIRTVTNTAEWGCRILNDLQADGDDGWSMTWDEIVAASDFAARTPEQILDIPTVAVAKGYGRGAAAAGVSMALFAGCTQLAMRSDKVTWVCSLERIPYIIVQDATKGVMQEFEGVEAKAYYGAPDTVPLWANFREWEAYLRHCHPRAHAMLMEGTGLDDFYFAFSEPATWESVDLEVIDLRRYDLAANATPSD